MIHKGCFGIPSIFSFTSKTCERCSDFSDCQQGSYAALSHVSKSLSGDLLTQHRNYSGTAPLQRGLNVSKPTPVRTTKLKQIKRELTAEQESIVDGCQKNVGIFLTKLYERGMDDLIEDRILMNENAFEEDGYRPYHLAYKYLTQGCVSRPYMTQMFQQDMGWTRKAARSQSAVVWEVFLALDLAEVQGAYLAPRPRIPCKNRSYRQFGRV